MSAPIRINTKPTPAQVAAIIKAGPGAVVHHPLASFRGRRRQLEQALGRAGVPHRLVRTLGWTSVGAKAQPASAPAVADEAPPRRSKSSRRTAGSD